VTVETLHVVAEKIYRKKDREIMMNRSPARHWGMTLVVGVMLGMVTVWLLPSQHVAAVTQSGGPTFDIVTVPVESGGTSQERLPCLCWIRSQES